MYDEVLLSLAEQGQGLEVLRFWETPDPCVILGRISCLDQDICIDHVREDNLGIWRRSSGGGTVLQGPGCLNYALVLSKDGNPALNDLHRSYREIMDRIVKALSVLKVNVAFRPLSDLILVDGEKKFSGNAQHRGRKYLLHHGTFLYDFDLILMERYLRIPLDMPAYRRKRSHRDFLANLPLGRDALKQALREAFGVRREESSLSATEAQMLRRMKQRRFPVLSCDLPSG